MGAPNKAKESMSSEMPVGESGNGTLCAWMVTPELVAPAKETWCACAYGTDEPEEQLVVACGAFIFASILFSTVISDKSTS